MPSPDPSPVINDSMTVRFSDSVRSLEKNRDARCLINCFVVIENIAPKITESTIPLARKVLYNSDARSSGTTCAKASVVPCIRPRRKLRFLMRLIVMLVFLLHCVREVGLREINGNECFLARDFVFFGYLLVGDNKIIPAAACCRHTYHDFGLCSQLRATRLVPDDSRIKYHRCRPRYFSIILLILS